jgi:hypothetical protein
MTIEKVLGFTFDLFKKEPKIVLPNVLTWIPAALLSLLILHAILRFGSFLSWQSVQTLETKALWGILREIFVYVIIAIPIFILLVITNLLIISIYSDITKQFYTRRRISLIDAFSTAKLRMVSLLWTYFLESLILIGAIAGLLIVGMFMGVIGFILSFIVAIVVSILAIVFFFETPAIVVVERKSGLKAIARSYEIGKRYFWSMFAVVLILTLCIGIVNVVMNSIPVVGRALFNLVNLFLATWIWITPASFYFEYENGKSRFGI